MNNDEYQSFLKYVFHEYIDKRLLRSNRYFNHPKMSFECYKKIPLEMGKENQPLIFSRNLFDDTHPSS